MFKRTRRVQAFISRGDPQREHWDIIPLFLKFVQSSLLIMLWWEITWFGNFISFRIPKNPFTWPAWIFQEALVSKGHLNPSRQLNLEACRRRIERILTLIWGNSHLICTQQTGTGLNSKLNNYPKIDRSKPNACLRFLGLFSSNWAGSMRPKEMWVLQEKSRMLENANDLHLQLHCAVFENP